MFYATITYTLHSTAQHRYPLFPASAIKMKVIRLERGEEGEGEGEGGGGKGEWVGEEGEYRVSDGGNCAVRSARLISFNSYSIHTTILLVVESFLSYTRTSAELKFI